MKTRSSTKPTGASVPSLGTVCTKCNQAGHVSRECNVKDRLIIPLRVPPGALLALTRAQTALTTLPREIRDLLYEYLVTSSSPIKVSYDDDGSNVFIRLFETGEQGVAATFLCETVLNSSLAPEVYEVFFKKNTFECVDSHMLEQFISSGHTKVGIRTNKRSESTNTARSHVSTRPADLHRPLRRHELRFDKRPWLRNIKIRLHCDFQDCKPVEQLGLVLKLPRLQHLDVLVQGLCNKRGYINTVDVTIAQIAIVCNKIREKIGSGLKVQVLKHWHKFCDSPVYHYLNECQNSWLDVSWMWEPPSQEECTEVELAMAAHREHVQGMVATANLLQGSQLRLFGSHWRRYYEEIEAQAQREILAKRNMAVVVVID